LFLIFGTDGLFEFLSNEELCQIVLNHMADLNKAANACVDASRRLWIRNTKGSYVDDISILIVRL
jgi:serine/threonine protein phosphatase PrpC